MSRTVSEFWLHATDAVTQALRVAFRVSLEVAFADFDDVNVAVDRETLSAEDLGNVVELLKLRPIQFCLFLKGLVGVKNMERLVNQGIAHAKQTE